MVFHFCSARGTSSSPPVTLFSTDLMLIASGLKCSWEGTKWTKVKSLDRPCFLNQLCSFRVTVNYMNLSHLNWDDVEIWVCVYWGREEEEGERGVDGEASCQSSLLSFLYSKSLSSIMCCSSSKWIHPLKFTYTVVGALYSRGSKTILLCNPP